MVGGQTLEPRIPWQAAREPRVAAAGSTTGATTGTETGAAAGQGIRETGRPPRSPPMIPRILAAVTPEEAVTISCLTNAQYHASREAFLDTVHRWFMFTVIALGATALLDVIPEY